MEYTAEKKWWWEKGTAATLELWTSDLSLSVSLHLLLSFVYVFAAVWHCEM